ncbi:restriction endonuclease subunit S [Candidatus Wolfebacteria bacterium]|nr:restriction endonuclease subunit S [Candidatus Wolfebacteria bacterium]
MTYPTKKLGEVAEVIMGQSPPSSSYNEQGKGLPFFQGKAEFGEIYPAPVKYCSSPSRIAEANDVLISVRAPVGNINIAREKSCVGRGLGALRAKKNILNQMFLFYFMKKNENNWSRLLTGSTFSAIKGSSLKNFGIPLPPLEIQKQIVERLDKIVEAQKLNDDLIQKADELFQSLLHKELNPVGKDWDIKKLSEIGEIVTGNTPSTKNGDYWNGEFLWATPTDIKENTFILTDTPKKLSHEGYEKTRPVPQNAILVTCIASIGKMAIAGKEMATNQQINSIVCNKDNDPLFIFFSLQKDKKKLISLGKTTAVPIINKSEFGRIKIFLPPLETQKQIVAKLSAVQDYKKQLLEQKMKFKELFDSALAESMTSEKSRKSSEFLI